MSQKAFQKRRLATPALGNLQGLTKEDLGLLLHGLRSIHVAALAVRQAKLQRKIEAEMLQKFGVNDVRAS